MAGNTRRPASAGQKCGATRCSYNAKLRVVAYNVQRTTRSYSTFWRFALYLQRVANPVGVVRCKAPPLQRPPGSRFYRNT